VNKNKQLIICLKIYTFELTENFFISPHAIILLYDITSKDSFDSLISYYNKLKNDKRYNSIKYILVGNKIDLIEEEDDEQNNKYEGKDDKEKKEEIREENENLENNNELKDKDVNNEINDNNKSGKNIKKNKINNENYFKEIIEKENFDLKKEISGLNSFNLEELFDEISCLLYKTVKDLENVGNEQYKTENDLSFTDNKIEIGNRQSYFDDEYKNEVNKINKTNNKGCCLYCNIV
jgi:GTPase SAR1 family protein